jgi:hypothetical protein
MNREENLVFHFLKTKYPSGNIIFEPYPNLPPDFSVNSSIGIEVRRLNQNSFTSDGVSGYETLDINIHNAILDVLDKFPNVPKQPTYMVCYEYSRQITIKLLQFKKQLAKNLDEFLQKPEKEFPYKISIKDEIFFEIYQSEKLSEKIFFYGACSDNDMFKSVLSVYLDNINYCISEKSKKISKKLEEFETWHLYLIDNIFPDNSNHEKKELLPYINNLGNFNEIILLNFSGDREDLHISKQI